MLPGRTGAHRDTVAPCDARCTTILTCTSLRRPISPQAICVPRSRFAPVKTTGDLLALMSDAYEVTRDFRMVLKPSRNGVPPVVKLDDLYKFVDNMKALIPDGAPSLIQCTRLEVKATVGEVWGRLGRCEGGWGPGGRGEVGDDAGEVGDAEDAALLQPCRFNRSTASATAAIADAARCAAITGTRSSRYTCRRAKTPPPDERYLSDTRRRASHPPPHAAGVTCVGKVSFQNSSSSLKTVRGGTYTNETVSL